MSHTLIPITFQHDARIVTNLYPPNIASLILQHFTYYLPHIQITQHPPITIPSSATLYNYKQHALSHYTDPSQPFVFHDTHTPYPFPRKIPTEQLPLNPYALKHKPNYINQAVRKHLIDKQS